MANAGTHRLNMANTSDNNTKHRKNNDIFFHRNMLPADHSVEFVDITFWSSPSLLFISLGCHPLEGVTPHLFYLFDLVCPLFFVNSVTPLEGVTRGGPPLPQWRHWVDFNYSEVSATHSVQVYWISTKYGNVGLSNLLVISTNSTEWSAGSMLRWKKMSYCGHASCAN